ncbi:type II toxin-antitoxin system VapC family toxin [Rhodoferax antarcticus]|uniref:type II toxin-antitoxin system VapC family toxin n=1 Tax=Rhodoferax antarcticus TaxID=81479 RepID=UPI0022257E30|nr:hypothetical protein [Rhodoferax antarcticus]MCW2313181.1 putative nucleic acid-binding protein [Rhodoferax antarcticus]
MILVDSSVLIDLIERTPEWFGITYLHIPAAAAHAASAAHRTYRAAGGSRAATLPDFFIGAHAQVAGHTLMTRDAKRMLTYFPHVPVLSPR